MEAIIKEITDYLLMIKEKQVSNLSFEVKIKKEGDNYTLEGIITTVLEQ